MSVRIPVAVIRCSLYQFHDQIALLERAKTAFVPLRAESTNVIGIVLAHIYSWRSDRHRLFFVGNIPYRSKKVGALWWSYKS